MLINHESRWIYTAIPKTATKSISCAFGHTQHPEPAIYHATIRDIIAAHPETAGYRAWTVVRNPFSRLVSCYFDFTVKRGYQYSEHVRHDKPLLSEFDGFQDFCLRLGDSHWKDDIFFKPQVEFTAFPEGLAVPIMIVKYEYDLQTALSEVCNSLGIRTPTLEHYNNGEYDKAWRKYYTSTAQVEAVAKLYDRDLRAFGYAF